MPNICSDFCFLPKIANYARTSKLLEIETLLPMKEHSTL